MHAFYCMSCMHMFCNFALTAVLIIHRDIAAATVTASRAGYPLALDAAAACICTKGWLALPLKYLSKDHKTASQTI
jgi:hypothetical protein